jgi:peptidoglycan/LPS O-acetylase OafA/YrhL
MMGCKLVLAKKQPTFSNYFLLGLILSIVFVTNYLYQHSIKFYWSLGALLIDLAILAAILLHTNLGNKAVPQKNLLLRFFIFLGIISYGVYAWHPYLAKYVPWLENNTLLVVITTVCIAFVSYKFIEQPILKMKKQRKESVAVS